MPMHAHACPCMPMQNHSTYIRPATPHARTWTHTRGNDMVVHIGESSLTHRVRSRDRAIDLDLDLDLARGRPVLRYPQPTTTVDDECLSTTLDDDIRVRTRGSTDIHHASRGARARVPVRGVQRRRWTLGDDIIIARDAMRWDDDEDPGGARAHGGADDDEEDDDDARRGGWG